jgi:mannose-6-phosphate isomerase-like protein (cupin superfamily)
MTPSTHFVTRFDPAAMAPPPEARGRSEGYVRLDTLGFLTGAIHTGHALCELAPGGFIAPHLHAYEQSFYILSGSAVVDLDGRAWRVAADDFGLAAYGMRHAWRNVGSVPVRWLEISAPQPRPQSPIPQTLWLRGEAPSHGMTREPKDPTVKGLGHFSEEMLPPPAHATVDGYSGGNIRGASIKMLVDHVFGAQHHNLFVVQFEPGGIGTLHDHAFEESYLYLSGEMTGYLDGKAYDLRPNDIVWNGVGGAHEFRNTGKTPARWLETMAPQPPGMHAFRFQADWDWLAKQADVTG